MNSIKELWQVKNFSYQTKKSNHIKFIFIMENIINNEQKEVSYCFKNDANEFIKFNCLIMELMGGNIKFNSIYNFNCFLRTTNKILEMNRGL